MDSNPRVGRTRNREEIPQYVGGKEDVKRMAVTGRQSLASSQFPVLSCQLEFGAGNNLSYEAGGRGIVLKSSLYLAAAEE